MEPPGRRARDPHPPRPAAALPGLRGAIVPLVGGERNAKAFADSTVHFHELLILEKPPEMSKKKRKPKGAEPTVAGVPLTATPVLEAQESSEAVNAQLAASAMEQRAQDTAVAAAARAASDPSLAVAAAANTETALAVVKPESIHPTANYRMMFSLYRKDSDAPPPAEGTQCSGRHLTFCMAPEDILIRNSPHMLSETEKARRATRHPQLGATSARRRFLRARALHSPQTRRAEQRPSPTAGRAQRRLAAITMIAAAAASSRTARQPVGDPVRRRRPRRRGDGGGGRRVVARAVGDALAFPVAMSCATGGHAGGVGVAPGLAVHRADSRARRRPAPTAT